jgi:LPXTG-site transpeptidase (sortase) family protein
LQKWPEVDTALPGEPGNVVLAGHRDTFFRGLRNIRKGDEITLETLDGSYRYRVDLTQVVAPEYTEVLRGSDDAILTLVTCYPFSFVGPAPQRYIVRAQNLLSGADHPRFVSVWAIPNLDGDELSRFGHSVSSLAGHRRGYSACSPSDGPPATCRERSFSALLVTWYIVAGQATQANGLG